MDMNTPRGRRWLLDHLEMLEHVVTTAEDALEGEAIFAPATAWLEEVANACEDLRDIAETDDEDDPLGTEDREELQLWCEALYETLSEGAALEEECVPVGEGPPALVSALHHLMARLLDPVRSEGRALAGVAEEA